MKRWLPWILSAAIVAFLVLTTDLDAVGDALSRADWPRLFGLMALVTVAAYVADTGTLVVLFRRLVAPVGLGEVFAIKGVSYFLNAINYSLAAGGMAYVLARRHGKPFLETFSALLWFFFVDIIALTVLLTAGYVFGHELIADASFIDELPTLIGVLWAVILGALVYWNAGFDFVAFGFFRRWRLFHTFATVRLADYPVMIALRTGFVLVYVAMHWLLLPAFDVHIPFTHLLMYAPLITFVQVIPATVSGLGAVQGVMVALFAGHVHPAVGDPRAIIVAYSTVIGPLMMLYRLVIGYVFVASVSKDLVPTKEEVEAAQARAKSTG